MSPAKARLHSLAALALALAVLLASAPPAAAHGGVPDVVGEQAIYAVAWNSDGSRFAIGTRVGNISVYEWPNNGLLLSWHAHDGPINQIAFSPDGSKMLSASGAYENNTTEADAKIWQLNFAGSPTLLHVLSGQRDWVVSAVWSPDGKMVATSSGIDDHIHPGQAYGEVYFWDAATGDLRWNTSVTRPLPSYPSRIAWSPDGRELATIGHLNDIWLINYTTKTLLQINGTYRDPVGHASHGWSIAWNPDSRYLAAGFSRDLDNDNATDAGPVVIIDTTDIRDGVAAHIRAAIAHDKPVEWLDWDSTGQYVASCSGGDYLDANGSPGQDGVVDAGEVVIYNNSAGGPALVGMNKFVGGFSWCASIAWRPGNLTVLAGNADGSARSYILDQDGDGCWVWEDAAPLDPTTCVAPQAPTDDFRNLLIMSGVGLAGVGGVLWLRSARAAEAKRFGVDEEESNGRRNGGKRNGARPNRRRR